MRLRLCAEAGVAGDVPGASTSACERLRHKDEPQAALLEQWLQGLRVAYQDHLIEMDASVAEEWGRLNVPDPLPVIDGLLAASAKVRGWTLVTSNTADLQRSSAALLNPFEPRPAP